MKYNVYIDWDNANKIKNEKSLLKRISYFLQKTKECNILKENIEIKEISYRLSSIKGIHLRITVEMDDIIFKEEDTFLLLILMFRAVWKDDSERIRIDLERYAKYSDISKTNRIFDIKVRNGKKYCASEWVKVER